MRRFNSAPVSSTLYRNFAVVALFIALGMAFFGNGPDSAAASAPEQAAPGYDSPQAASWASAERAPVEIVPQAEADGAASDTDLDESARLVAARTAEVQSAPETDNPAAAEAKGPVRPTQEQIGNLLAGSARRSGASAID